ncbi:zinc finger protein 583-like isoform X11 [Achroia grisella]|uniref:zinc finger protein 583-like isoform X11 n=1 Tax=Achroia grisella TaxID=688607 RepID=UPI0027D24333|nr:zinc finger protein 583-like isoform X11 [Achroia grisella]
MAAKTMEWRPGPTVCRCCLAEGCYKDISTEYFWMGKREVYSEMLSETFSVSIAYSTAGGPNSNSRLICEPCISRLRDASDFKRQVQECERTFMQHLDPGSTSTAGCELTVEPEDVKIETVKLEAHLSDVDVDDGPDFGDDDDDDLDDEPLTKFATKVPKKESVDLLDLIDNSKAAEKRKSTTKVKATPAKKTKKETVKPTSSKPKPEKKKKENEPMYYVRRNAETVVQYATAYPFRLPEDTMACVYCYQTYTDSSQFRKHMEDEHHDFPLWSAFGHVPEGYIKVDCTDLRCRICSEGFDKLGQVADHLLKIHSKTCINLSHDLGLQPFKLVKGMWICALCDEKFSTLRTLSRHTQTHFAKYTCESCGKSYSMASSLQVHIKNTHVSDEKICRKCRKTFKTLDDKRKHLNESPRCWSYLCNLCGKRFVTWNLKQVHLSEAHGVEKKSYVCPECSEIFLDRNKYHVHFKITHTNNHYTCPFCELKFDNKRGLDEHKVVHTKEKLYPCSLCTKSFGRKKNLTQHMWIHSEHKRFECTLCNKQFNQRVSWRTHMKSYHPDILIPPYQPTSIFDTEEKKFSI